MKVVLADVQAEPLDKTVDRAAGQRRRGHRRVTDVTDLASVEALRDATLERLRRRACGLQQRRHRRRRRGRCGSTSCNDWRWALAVNCGASSTASTPSCPAMLDGGDEGHIVNTSSGNGGVSPLSRHAAVRRHEGGRRDDHRMPLRPAARRRPTKVSVPPCCSPARTCSAPDLFESWRTGPTEFAKERPRQTPYTTVEDARGADEGGRHRASRTRRCEQSPTRSVDGDPRRRSSGSARRASAPTRRLLRPLESMLKRTNPDYLRAVPG